MSTRPNHAATSPPAAVEFVLAVAWRAAHAVTHARHTLAAHTRYRDLRARETRTREVHARYLAAALLCLLTGLAYLLALTVV